jgi:cation diffusion facilitator family transporter
METALVKRKIAVARLSVLSNTALVLLKLLVGALIGSVAVVSEALHSAADLLAALIALFAVRFSGRPADAKHPYGHEKMENISGAIEALLIFFAAGWIIYEAVRKLLHPTPLEAPVWGAAVMLVSCVVNIIVSRQLFAVGRESHSPALLADAWHLRTDVWTSAGVTAGLGLLWLGEHIWPGANLHWIDPVAALLVALLILKAAWELTWQSVVDLLDVSLPAEELDWIKHYVSSLQLPGRGMHDLRTRRAGQRRFIEFHLELDPRLSVDRSHAITEQLEAAIIARFPGAHITVHVEPCGPECDCHRTQAECPNSRRGPDAGQLSDHPPGHS